MKKALIIFFLLQVIDFHLCEEDGGLDTDLTALTYEALDTELTAEERLEMEAAFEEADRMEAEDRIEIAKPDVWCGNKRWRECRKKLWKLFREAKKLYPGNVKGIFRYIDGYKGRCVPCICRGLSILGPRIFGSKMTLELLGMFNCYPSSG